MEKILRKKWQDKIESRRWKIHFCPIFSFIFDLDLDENEAIKIKKKKAADLKGEEMLCDKEYCLNDSYGEYIEKKMTG